MPNRILKESICISDSIDQLSWFEEVLFYRLIVNCDDYGRFDGRLAVIKNRLFPLKENLTLKNVESAINRLARAGLVTPYEAGGKPFLFLPSWTAHQTVRAAKSRFPEPEIICNQMISGDSECSRNTIQSYSKSYSKSNSKSESNAHADFEVFWKAYPRKEGKKTAEVAFLKVTEPLEKLITAIENQKKSSQWTKDGGQYIPHPATWLNGKRWEDELVPGKQEIPKGASGELGEAELDAIKKVLSQS